MNINIYSSFEDAKKTWIRFEEVCDFYGFQCFQWLEHWYNTIGQHKRHKLLCISITTKNSEPLIFLPLIIEYIGPVRCLTWQGDKLSDYQAPLIHKEFSAKVSKEEFITLWNDLLKKIPYFDVIHFLRIPERVGAQENPFLFLNLSPNEENSYATNFSDANNWDTFYSTQVKNKIRLDSKRQIKRLSEIGPLQFIMAKDPNDIVPLIEKMVVQKRRRYRETHANDIFRNKRYGDFYLQAALSLVPQGFINVSAIILGDKILATHWGMICGETFYYLMPTHEGGEWKKYSIGRLLLEYLMAWSYNHGIKTFDFTVGGEHYKKVWCNHEMKLFESIVAKNNMGKLYVLIQKMRKYLRGCPVLLKLFKKGRAKIYNLFG